MWRVIAGVALMAGGLALAGCGLSDSRAPVPAFMRNPALPPPPPEPPPDVKRLVSEKVDAVFVAASKPHRIRVSPPRRDIRGSNWTACVRAELISVIGKPLGTQTYCITISGGAIVDRRRAEETDNCASEDYEPI